MPHSHRLVLDTNVLLAGLTSRSSASQKIVDGLLARKVVPLVSAQVLMEYREVLLHPAIQQRFRELTPRRIEMALHRLRYLGDEIQTTGIRFDFKRDPLDAKFIELAIAGRATHIVTLDDDLLSLPASRSDAGKRFRQRLPSVKALKPGELLEHYPKLFG